MFFKQILLFRLNIFKNNKINRILASCCNENAQLYIFGGFIRDRALGIKYKDIDYLLVNMEMKEFYKNLSEKLGPGIRIYPQNDCRQLILYANGRRGKTTIDIGQIDYSIEKFLSIADITINTFAYQINSKKSKLLHNPLALQDLKKKVIRTTECKDKNHFEKHPRHLIRVIRQSVQLDFEIDPNTYDSLAKYKHLVNEVEKEDLQRELIKIFRMDNTTKVLELMHETGLLFEICPFLEKNDNLKESIDQISQIEKLAKKLPKSIFENLNNKKNKKLAFIKLAALLKDTEYNDWLKELEFNIDEISYITEKINSFKNTCDEKDISSFIINEAQ